MFWLPSPRERLNVKLVKAPPLLEVSCVLCPRAKGIGFGHPVVVNGEDDPNAPRPVQGLNTESVALAPQARGLASGERGPPLALNFSSLNGSCGLFRKLTSMRPVLGFGTACPSRRTETP